MSIWGYSVTKTKVSYLCHTLIFNIPGWISGTAATLHCLSMFLLPVTLGVGSKLVLGQVRLEVFLLLDLALKRNSLKDAVLSEVEKLVKIRNALIRNTGYNA